MSRVKYAFAALLLTVSAAAAQVINPGVPVSGAPANNDCAKFVVSGGNVQSITTNGSGCASPVNGANPTATAGPAAVNGVASTYLRSDGAPAIQLGTNGQKGIVQVDGSTITAAAGVITGASTTFAGQSVAPGASAATQGNGAKIQASTGTTTTNDCVKFDANGNTVDAGAACGTSSGANPTATAGPVAVNGVAGTFLRSDGAPAIQLGTNAQKGLVQVDGTTITAAAGVITTANTTIGGQSTAPGGSTTNQGNGGKIQLSTGTTTTNDCVKYDASGNVIDSGAACGTGTVTSAQVAAGTGITVTGTCTITTTGVCTVNASNWILLNTLTASNSATLSDTTSLTGTYTQYAIEFENLVSATTQQILELQVHSGGAFKNTGYLSTCWYNIASATTNCASASTTFVPVSNNTSGNANSPANVDPGVSGSCRVTAPSASHISVWRCETAYIASGGTMVYFTSSGVWNTAGVVDGFQVLMSSGNITSGVVKIFGIQ